MPPESGSPRSYRPHPAVVSAVVDGATVLMSPAMDFIELDAAGGVFWSLLEQAPRHDELVAAICARYDIDRERASADLQAFVDRLAELGIVQVEDS